MVECGDEHYPSSPSKVESEEAMAAVMEMPFKLKNYGHQ